MADSTDTKVPTITKIDPKTRLLSYSLQTDHVTAPAQYYPLPLPRTNASKPNILYADPDNDSEPSEALKHPNDRSIIVYGTKNGLTILYPRRSQRYRPNDSSDSDIEMLDRNDWVVYESEDIAQSQARFSPEPYDLKYESYSEPEGFNCQRNARFPWKYSIDLGSPVTEFALPTLNSLLDSTNSLAEPWNQNVYITAITEDGVVRLVALPLRLPPPGMNSTRNFSTPDFPVDIITLKPGNRRQPRPRGICMGLLQRMLHSGSP
ncbi:hypothetical protein TWF696_007819 [Orbilia brochopaga]|uniref:Uncharacterized protein n=1 Tax=Orbilia brochopaga TaxID=3140254 RepID=A0AAV9UQ24_9PEZI